MTPEPSRNESRTVGHVVTPEPSLTGRWARCHRTHGDTRALPCWVWGLASWDLT
jgi:hypothetical protein